MPEIKNMLKNNNDEIDLLELFSTLKNNKKIIIFITLLFCLCGVTYALFSTPVYKADALIQVENNKNSSLLGDLGSIFSNSQSSSSAEIELIKSRMVLGKTIDELKLTTQITPYYFPIFGKGWARLTHQPIPEIAISRFEIAPDHQLDKAIVLTTQDDNKFTLKYNEIEIQGNIGEIIKTDNFSILVNDIKAPIGTKFNISKQSFINVFNGLLSDLSVADKGKETGILMLTYAGENPNTIRQVLNNISKNYFLQNIDRKSEEVGKSLAFLNEQLPELRVSLNEAENKLNKFRQDNESVDLSLEAKSVLDQMVTLESQLKELQLSETEISKLYTKQHPTYLSLLEKKKTLTKAKEGLNDKVGNMPKTQQEILRLTRDVESGQAVYMQLLNKQQELQINKASTIGNVRIIDQAITQTNPIKPNKKLVVLISAILGFIIAVGYILLRVVLHAGIKRSDEIESIGINVYALVPKANINYTNNKTLSKKHPTYYKGEQVLSIQNPLDPSIEAIRSLRTTLHFAMLNARNNILMISSATAGIGKSFISSNLACVIAQLNNGKVLLIDSDLRKGYLHRLLNVSNKKEGLSTFLSGKASIEDIVEKTMVENLDFIPRGQVPPNPSELLMHERFKELLDWANNEYSLIIIDTPPILPVTDSAIIGSHVGCALLVVRYNISTLKEIEMSMTRFNQNGIEIKGVILNAVEQTSADYKYSYYNYTSNENDK